MLFKMKIIFVRIQSLLRGRSGTQFAKDCGVKQQTMDNYIRGDRIPTVENLLKICTTNGVSMDWICGLVDGDGQPSKAKVTLVKKVKNLVIDAVSVNKEAGQYLEAIQNIVEAL